MLRLTHAARDEHTMHMSLSVAWLIVGGLLFSSSRAQDPFSLNDLRHEVRLVSAQISPDGKQVLVVTSHPNYDENRYVNRLMLIDVSSGETRRLTFDRPDVRMPRWSPTGNFIAFIAEGSNEKQQVFVMDMRGGEARDLTSFAADIDQFSWSPYGNAIAFTAPAPIEKPKGKQAHNKSFPVEGNSYLVDEPYAPIHLWITRDEEPPRQLTSGTESVVSPFGVPFDFSPDGGLLVYVARTKPDSGYFTTKVLKKINRNTGEVSILIREPGKYDVPRFSPDGKTISVVAPRGGPPLFSPFSVYTLPAKGGELVDAIHELDRSVFGSWLPDWRRSEFSAPTLLLTGPDSTRKSAWLQRIGDAPQPLNLGNVHVSSTHPSTSPSGKIAFIGSEPDQPPEVFVLDSADSKPRRLTCFNAELKNRRTSRVETVTWSVADGFQADGILCYPLDFQAGKKYPLLLHIHGGPMSSSTESFALWDQIMAAKGWLVFRPNYRGSDNLGSAYQQAVINDAGKGPGEDVLSGVEALIARNIVDESRMAVSGWSYGGFMTVWLAAHDDRWKAAVAGAAVTDWFDQYNVTDLNRFFGLGLGGSPWTEDRAEKYIEQSPITYADSIKTPTLILATKGDARVAVSQSYKLFRAIKDNGVESEFIVYPVSGHFPSDPVHRDDVVRRWIEWIEKKFDQ